MATSVAFLITISSIYQSVYGGLRREIFSFAGPLYLPDDPMGTASYANVSYTPDIEIQFDLIEYSWIDGGNQIFRLGKPDCCQWEYPLILQFGEDSWVAGGDQTGKLRAVWDKPGYDHGVTDIPYNVIDSPPPHAKANGLMANWGVPYKIYYRLTPNYMYLQINDGIGQYGATVTETLDPPYDPSCCLDDVYQVYIGADSWREAANVTISNLYVYAIDPTDPPTSNPSGSPTTAEPSLSPTTSAPSESPTNEPTTNPTDEPSASPTSEPTEETSAPSYSPTEEPTNEPTYGPTMEPIEGGDTNPTDSNEPNDTDEPTNPPTDDKSMGIDSKHGQLFAIFCAVCFCFLW